MLKKQFRGNEKVTEENIKPKADYWKRRPSEMRGYQKTYYVNADDGSYLRLDYNLKDKKIRIYLEDASEGGISYYSVIEKGKIIQEKNLATGRASSLADKIIPRASLIVTVPQRDILQLFGDNYGISAALNEKKEAFKKMKYERTRQRYFKDDEKTTFLGSFHANKGFRLVDLFDTLAGGAIGVALYFFVQDKFTVPGIFSAFYGIAIGIVDIFIREREPIFTKIFLFVLSGAALYLYGRFFW